jgi:hypothetical protein
VCPTGRLVVLKFQADPIPDTLRERQIIDGSAEQLLEHFLKPLYRGLELTKLDAPLNPRVADFDLKRDALQIEEALLGLSDLRPDRYGESLIVETNGLDVTKDGGLAAALVKAPNARSAVQLRSHGSARETVPSAGSGAIGRRSSTGSRKLVPARCQCSDADQRTTRRIQLMTCPL